MMFIKLKDYRKDTIIEKCPFCGENEEIFLEEHETTCGKRWRIFCSNCMCMIDRGYDQEPGVLIELWNKRAK